MQELNTDRLKDDNDAKFFEPKLTDHYMLIHNNFDKDIQIIKDKRIYTIYKEYKTRYDFDKCLVVKSKSEEYAFEKPFKYLIEDKLNEEQTLNFLIYGDESKNFNERNMIKMLFDYFRFKNDEFIKEKDDEFIYKMRMKVFHSLEGKKVANLTSQMFPPGLDNNNVPKPKDVELKDVIIKYDKDIFESEYSSEQDFNKKLLYKFHNMFAYREQFPKDEFIYMFNIQLLNENEVISEFHVNMFDVPYVFEEDLAYTDARDLNRGFKDKQNYHKTRKEHKSFLDCRSHHKEMMHLRKVLEQVKYREKFVEWDACKYSRLFKYMIYEKDAEKYRNQKIVLVGMVNVPKHVPKDRKDFNSMLVTDSHIFRFTTKFTQMKCVREAVGKEVADLGTNYNKSFFDPALEGVDLRAQMEKMEQRTQGSLASKIATAKELNKMKKEEEGQGSMLEQYRQRNIDSRELASLFRHEFIYDREEVQEVRKVHPRPVYSRSERAFKSVSGAEALQTYQTEMDQMKPFLKKDNLACGEVDYVPGKKIDGYDHMRAEKGYYKFD